MPDKVEEEYEAEKNRMPESLRKHLMRVQGGKLYLPAAYRLVWFRDMHPDWGVMTCVLEGGEEAGFVAVQATITNEEGRVISTGIKTESRKDFPAGFVEKAETGAISRALAVAGYGTQFGNDLEEGRLADAPLGKASRMGVEEFAAKSGGRKSTATQVQESLEAKGVKHEHLNPSVWEGPGQCPRCFAPEGKRHGKPCIG